MTTPNRFQLLIVGVLCVGTLGVQACGKEAPPPSEIPTAAVVTAEPPAPEVGEAPSAPIEEAPTPTTQPFVPSTKPSIYDLDLDLETQADEKVKLNLNVGKPVVISMFYASCPAVCPTLIRDLKKIDEALAPNIRAQTQFLLVTFDPVADTPEKLRKLAEDHGITDPRWTFARANDDDATRELSTSLGIRYRAVEDGHFNHSTMITLLDRAGRPLARIDGLNQDATALLATLAAAP